MPSIQRPLSGDVMRFDLRAEDERTADPATIQAHGRAARTLLKDGPLRITMIVLAPGGTVAEHHADGPITIQPLRGTIRFTAAGEDHEIGPGELLSAGAGVRHSVASDDGAAFLLTVSLPHAPAGL
jgi:quercetin dioxygenase-like cupin family protein